MIQRDALSATTARRKATFQETVRKEATKREAWTVTSATRLVIWPEIAQVLPP